ncbi:uncharacterized protein PV09_04083 [Verruconis gallopava]|uniref:NAD-dependent epimerase/dehydratase domain-containing protein n=1 Tax=Verruconis gallopava TaxID=253628 RepID=A0A0D1YW49_9PEZI|nr:uncharacterized protein PV09_04083 [Verruconis gallopava]KIW04912.1 hypothetical protein PV09_04083 [Verruconis gallopava]
MKIILTGGTGFVGGQVLKELIRDDRVTSVVAISRRPLKMSHAKLEVVIHKDFEKWDDDALLEKLKGSEACIWCVGGGAWEFPDYETAYKVQVTYTVNAAKAFAERLGPMRFVFCSGRWAARDERGKLRFFGDTRRIKGAAENGLLEIAKKHQGFFPYCMRIGGVMPASLFGTLITATVAWTAPVVKVDQAAKAMVHVALNGAKKDTLENEEIHSNKL